MCSIGGCVGVGGCWRVFSMLEGVGLEVCKVSEGV